MGDRRDLSDDRQVTPMPRELWPAGGSLHWRLVTDTVMGGVSRGILTRETIAGRGAIRMRGAVSTENNGGFIQIAFDLDTDGGFVDASAFTAIAVDVFGNDEAYGAHLRTTAMTRPQQSYRQGFVATSQWQTIRLPFALFAPHRIDAPLDVFRLRRVGLVAIGRAFDADLAVARLAFC
jgi:Complex I intermediate-associated protein 30 (CIA30)